MLHPSKSESALVQFSIFGAYAVMGIPVMGVIANHNVAQAYCLPIICYVVIFLFGFKFYKVREER